MSEETRPPSNTIDINFHNLKPQWMTGVEDFIYAVLARLEKSNMELSVLFCDDRYMSGLNTEYRGKEGPTDVLSFAQDGEGETGYINMERALCLGDIVISTETLERNATDDGIPFMVECKRLLIHGILHLSGMDHDTDHNEMMDIQDQILKDHLGGLF